MADLLTVPELEQMDDSAHVTGRVRALERAQRQTASVPALMIQRCRERAAMHRNTAVQMGRALMWFAQNPDAEKLMLWGVTWDRASVRSEYRAARHFHRRICRQLGDWRRRYAATLAAQAANTNAASANAAA